MAGSVIDVFGLLGEISGDAVFAERLRIEADRILVGREAHWQSRLVEAYLEGERETLRKIRERLYPEQVRQQTAARAATLGPEFSAFALLFQAPEPQLLGIAGALIRAYAGACQRFFGLRVIDRLLSSSLEDTPWKEVVVTVEGDFAHGALGAHSIAECGEILSTLLERWYAIMCVALGAEASQRLFELAYHDTDGDYGHLPMMPLLLGLTPRGVLWAEKVRRMHELESETMTQARSIRAADEGLERQAAQLQTTVDELQATRRQLEVVSHARSEFIDVVAHQFRTPLSSIRWNAELLADALAEKEIGPKFADPVETLRAKSIYLIDTLERVFAALDIETGVVAIDPKPAFLWEAAQDACTFYEKDIRHHVLKWTFQRTKEPLREILMDKTKIATVLKILIGNAIAYTNDGGTVTISVSEKTDGGKAYQEFSIADDGVGIRNEDLGRVFEKFHRTESARLKMADGAGLGMFIVKNFIEAHGGRVRVDSPGLGKGTTVSFMLPEN